MWWWSLRNNFSSYPTHFLPLLLLYACNLSAPVLAILQRAFLCSWETSTIELLLFMFPWISLVILNANILQLSVYGDLGYNRHEWSGWVSDYKEWWRLWGSFEFMSWLKLMLNLSCWIPGREFGYCSQILQFSIEYANQELYVIFTNSIDLHN